MTRHTAEDEENCTLLRSPASFDLQDACEDESSESSCLTDVPRDASSTEKDIEVSESLEPKASRLKLFTWIVINILATISIVLINKSIFMDPQLRGAQLSFAAFHFLVTFMTLHVVSLPRFNFFERKKAGVRKLLLVALAMALNVILPNICLAYSSITFYQTARVLLTPVVATLNFFLYGLKITGQAVLTLAVVCCGVGIVTYYETQPSSGANGKGAEVKETTMLGVIAGLVGIFASSIYTVWIGAFTKKLELTGVQLLHNLAPVGTVTLLYFIPWVDHYPIYSQVALSRWVLVLLSGLCACLINLSQFIIINSAGAVSSTVVGHTKTCLIVALGWLISHRSVSVESVVGCVIAIGGIIMYSAESAMRQRKLANNS